MRAQVSRAHALVDELRARVAGRVAPELEAACAALAARGGLGPPPPGALADEPLPLPEKPYPNPGPPGLGLSDEGRAAGAADADALGKRCGPAAGCPVCSPPMRAYHGTRTIALRAAYLSSIASSPLVCWCQPIKSKASLFEATGVISRSMYCARRCG